MNRADLQPGILLHATTALNETVFENAVIYIAEYNAKGAMGFIINKRFGRSLNGLQEFRHLDSFPLYAGGPVDPEHLFFIHRRSDVIEEGTLVKDKILLGGNFQQAVKAIGSSLIGENDIKIFIGYCGWDQGELEAEIDEGSWTTEVTDESSVFRF